MTTNDTPAGSPAPGPKGTSGPHGALDAPIETTPALPGSLEALAQDLDREFARLSADDRIRKAFSLFGSELTATTSFGRDAGLLLHHINRLGIGIRVFFIDTSFHFRQTLDYRDTLTSAYKLDLREVRSLEPDIRRYAVEKDGNLAISDTKACCGINKVRVQAAFLGRSDVKAFLTGLRRDQSETRAHTPFVHVQKGKLKICPFADWPANDVELYLQLREVPEHPLAKAGYSSIGCSPVTCTSMPLDPGDPRSGRWVGDAKTECGLHLDYEP
ncbi:MAG: phosphoadenylyl-sulfate reductase [Fibrobacterota bacterium]|nr:phosphoadenylyl-sulfate reductase [Fibrobacterota bacterium]